MSGYLGSIGFSFPGSNGRRGRRPGIRTSTTGAKSVSVSGDGGFGQYMGDFNTAVKYNMNITHVLLNNSELGKISKEQRAGEWPVWQTRPAQSAFFGVRESVRRPRYSCNQAGTTGRSTGGSARPQRAGARRGRHRRRTHLSLRIETMGAALTIFVLLSLSVFVIRVAAVALRLTGLDDSSARFQALSAFTGTGFTTIESEAIVNYPVRRKVVSLLMIVGNLGLVSVFATLVVSLVQTEGEAEAVLGAVGLVARWFGAGLVRDSESGCGPRAVRGDRARAEVEHTFSATVLSTVCCSSVTASVSASIHCTTWW